MTRNIFFDELESRFISHAEAKDVREEHELKEDILSFIGEHLNDFDFSHEEPNETEAWSGGFAENH